MTTIVPAEPEGSSPLVSTGWLARNLHRPDIRVVDVRWKSRFENGRGISMDDREAYLAGHIPGAVFAGMASELSDPAHPVSDMLAGPEDFARAMSRLGIGRDTLVVACDDMGFPLGAARLWWALNVHGHERVRVLDGGLRQWRLEGRPLSSDVPDVQPAAFVPRPRPHWIATKADVTAALGDPGTLVIDCLTPELYEGRGDRHMWGQRPGHIPGAVNVPYMANVDRDLARLTVEERGELLAGGRPLPFGDAGMLRRLYADAGLKPGQRVITYCGRGYAASCGFLALKILGHDDVRLYDGSWSEWSADPDLPIETGTRPPA
ncbi:MAG: sulfurtransferase [Hyphomicrobiales bacterium]